MYGNYDASSPHIRNTTPAGYTPGQQYSFFLVKTYIRGDKIYNSINQNNIQPSNAESHQNSITKTSQSGGVNPRNPSLSTNSFVQGVNPLNLHFGQAQQGAQSQTVGSVVNGMTSPGMKYAKAEPMSSGLSSGGTGVHVGNFNKQYSNPLGGMEMSDNVSINSHSGSVLGGLDKNSAYGANKRENVLNRGRGDSQ